MDLIRIDLRNTIARQNLSIEKAPSEGYYFELFDMNSGVLPCIRLQIKLITSGPYGKSLLPAMGRQLSRPRRSRTRGFNGMFPPD